MPTGNNPRLGEQVVPPPSTPIVQDPPPPVSPSGLSTAPAVGEPDPLVPLVGAPVADPLPDAQAGSVAVDGINMADEKAVDAALADAAAEGDGVLPVAEPEPVPELTFQEKARTILLEGTGVRIPLADPRDFRAFRVRGTNGLYYEHVSNAPKSEDFPDGEWEYRQTN